MTMRIRVSLALVLAIAGCSQPVQVPTESQFEKNPDLLKTWLGKCRHGEYSNLGQEETQHMCGSAESAAGRMVQLQAGKEADDTFGNILSGKE